MSPAQLDVYFASLRRLAEEYQTIHGPLKAIAFVLPDETQRLFPVQLAKPPEPPPSTDLREVHFKILEILTTEPQTAKAIAHKAGYRAAAHVRKALADLIKMGKVLHISDGYRLN